MVVISFVCLQKINNFPKFGRCGSKIEPATPIWNSKLDWAWQAQFLSHIHEFLQNYLFFKDLQMILVSFFEIFDGFWSTKKLPSLLLHVNQDLLVLYWVSTLEKGGAVFCKVYVCMWTCSSSGDFQKGWPGDLWT